MNKKLVGFVMSVAMLIFILAGCSTQPTDIATHTTYKSYGYEDLKAYAHTIALVSPTDELNEKNSYISYNPDNTISDYYSLRTIEIEKFYKNDQRLTDKIVVAERSVLTKNNEFIHPEGYESMKKGHKYIVFLVDTTDKKYPIIVSLNNGKVDLDNFKSNKNPEIAIKSLIEYELDNVSQEFKEGILKSSFSTSQVDFKGVKNKKVVKSSYGDIEVLHYYSVSNNKTYLWVNGHQFDIYGNITSAIDN